MTLLIRKVNDMATQESKQTSKYDPSWTAFTVTGKEIGDMGICNALAEFCEESFYVNENRVMLQTDDAVRMQSQMKIEFQEKRYTLHRFEQQNVLKDLADQMRQLFPDNRVDFEDNFYFNQYDYSAHGSDKIGWVYIEEDISKKKFHIFQQVSEMLLEDDPDFEYGLGISIPNTQPFDCKHCPENAVVIIVFAKIGHEQLS